MGKQIMRAALALAFSGTMAAFAPGALAQDGGHAQAAAKRKPSQPTLENLKSQLDLYRKQVDEQKLLMSRQARTLQKLEGALKDQATRVQALEVEQASAQAPARASAAMTAPARYIAVSQRVEQPPASEGESGAPQKPVGQAPGPQPRPQVQALAELGGVLTPKGVLSVEPSVEFDHISTNQLIFRGISIVQGLLIGVIDATDVRGDTAIGSLTGRYGVTNRLELEAKIPYLYRDNHETDVPSTSNAHPFKSYIQGHGIGDVEVAAHYQINSGTADWPIFVANLRYKSDTGTGPFDVGFDPTNAAPRALPTGSGFQALQPSLTMIYRSDPVVFFSNLEYDHNFEKDVHKTIAQTCGPQNNQPCRVGLVVPGDSFGATLGMAIALNEATSLTLGYQHYYIGGTRVRVAGTPTKSDSLQVGSLLVGASYQFGPRVGINFTTQIGATTDAPDVRVLVRVPIKIDLFN